MIAILLMILGTLFAAIGSVIVKIGLKDISIKQIKKNFKKQFKPLTFIGLGIIGLGIAYLLNIIALGYEHLSILFPISGFTYVWSTILAKTILKENVSKQKWFGVILIVIGVMLQGK